jgi:hypothetical protein
MGSAGQVWFEIGRNGSPHLRSDRCQQCPCTDDIHDARQVVGEYADCQLQASRLPDC